MLEAEDGESQAMQVDGINNYNRKEFHQMFAKTFISIFFAE
jgi:hypothetical protein